MGPQNQAAQTKKLSASVSRERSDRLKVARTLVGPSNEGDV